MKTVILRDDIAASAKADELDNLQEADFVEKILSQSHTVVQLPFLPDVSKTIQSLRHFSPDIVFNLVESVCGVGALSVLAAEVLEVLGIPYTGSKTFAHLLSADKMLAKRLMKREGIPTPSSDYIENTPYILKAKTEHASIGLDATCVVQPKDRQNLEDLVSEKEKKTGMSWIAEQYIDGREFNVAFLGKDILPPAEMCFAEDFEGPKLLTYEAKWDEKTKAYQKSCRSFHIDEETRHQLIDLTRLCCEKLFLDGYGRIDFRRDEKGDLFVIDINTNPCISPDAGFMAMSVQAGLSSDQVIERIVRNAGLS